MTSIQGKGAFITGGASGIGLALAKTMIARGARVMIADKDAAGLDRAQDELGSKVTAVYCDVADLDSVRQAAEAAVAAFGEVHLVFNNAGVGAGGVTGHIPIEDWRWAIDINLMGVVHGVETFAPILQRQGQGGHIVNTASMAGHVGAPMLAPYNATKFAVVGYSESLRAELKNDDIGVSVICPAFVRTNIYKSGRNRPSATSTEGDPAEALVKSVIDAGIGPDVVAEWAADCIEANRFYVFTHPEMKDEVEARINGLMSDYEACCESL